MKARFLAIALVFGCGVLSANGDPLPANGPNGGLIREAGEHHIELVVNGQTLTVHLLDHKSKPSSEAEVIGSAKDTEGNLTETTALEAKANGVFTGTGKFPATGALRVAVTLESPNEPELTASFDVTR